MRISKNPCYESPYIVIGDIKQAGSERKPKCICTDRIIGTQKANNMENLISMKCWQGKSYRYNLP